MDFASECTPFQYECQCGWPRCIDMTKYNNTVKDCADGSDEEDSANYKATVEKCSDNKQPRNRTIPIIFGGAPMLPCGPTETALAKNCNSDLGEICMVGLSISISSRPIPTV